MVKVAETSHNNTEHMINAANEVNNAIREQKREIEAMTELDSLVADLTTINNDRKRVAYSLRKKMRYLDTQL